MRSEIKLAHVLIIVAGLLAGCSGSILPPIMEEAEGKKTLVERVSALYPIGSNSQDLADELRKQGFQVGQQPWFDPKLRKSNGQKYRAQKKLHGNIFPCVAIIDWRPDAQDNILAYENVVVGCAGP